jgi:hypothetical protein
MVHFETPRSTRFQIDSCWRRVWVLATRRSRRISKLRKNRPSKRRRFRETVKPVLTLEFVRLTAMSPTSKGVPRHVDE